MESEKISIISHNKSANFHECKSEIMTHTTSATMQLASIPGRGDRGYHAASSNALGFWYSTQTLFIGVSKARSYTWCCNVEILSVCVFNCLLASTEGWQEREIFHHQIVHTCDVFMPMLNRRICFWVFVLTIFT